MMVWRCVIVAAVAAALSGPAWAAEKPAKPHPSLANWVARAHSGEVAALFRNAGVERGRVAILCKVADDGGLSGCVTAAATGGAQPVAEALLALAPMYRRKPPGPKDLREVLIVESEGSVDTDSDWARRPRPEDILGVYPRAAVRLGSSGSAMISCIVTTQGALRDCLPVEERPAGLGFGGAAMALAGQLTMRPARKGGQPVESVILIPINWPEVPQSGDLGGVRQVINGDLPWSLAPAFSDVAAAYPAKAKKARVGGRAMVACRLTGEGRLADCVTVSEQPKDHGFGLAAKALAKQFEFPVGSDEDRKAARSISIHLPVTFDPAMLDAGTAVVGKPKWAKLPDGEGLRAAFTERKVPDGARTAIECQVLLGGAVSDCKVAMEEPAGSGAGAAALSLASAFRLTTWTAEGLPTIGGTVRIPLRWQSEATPAAK